MKTRLRWTLRMGLVLTCGLQPLGHAEAVDSSGTSPAITIHVVNYARVGPNTLTEAEQVATGIFRKAGVETRWADIVLTAENNQANSIDHQAFTLADIQLNIFTDVMSDRSGLSSNVMGLAPGTGPDGCIV